MYPRRKHWITSRTPVKEKRGGHVASGLCAVRLSWRRYVAERLEQERAGLSLRATECREKPVKDAK